ncbi:type II secretion system secretin GspD, partial [bacterium]|nr:type II secretion system secretin GspD [bacterium]
WKTVKPEDVFSVLEAILQMNGLSAVKSGDLWKIIPSPNAKEYPLETLIGKDPDNIYKADRMITQIIPLEYINAQDALTVIKGFLSKYHGEYADPNTNILIITDYSANIQNVLKIISVLDVEKAVNQLRVFKLNFAEVQDVTNIISQFFQNQISSRKSSSPPMRRGGRPPGSPTTSQTIGSALGEAPIIIPEPRSNTIIVYGSVAALNAVGEIIKLIDVDIYTPEKTYVYYVQHQKAENLAKTLSSLYGKTTKKQKTSGVTTQTRGMPPDFSPGGVETETTTGLGEPSGVKGDVTIVSDEETNALIIITDPQNWPQITQTIEMLDIMPKQVLLEALIAEISLNEQTQFGISWYLKGKSNANIFGESQSLSTNTALNLGKTSSPTGFSNAPLGLSYSVIDPVRLASLLTLYASGSKLNVLSSPHLLASNNQEATIDIGSQVPIVTSETLDSTVTTNRYNQIQYKNTGVILHVTPHVNSERFVRLEIDQEVSEALENTLGGTTSPIIQQRKVKSNLMVKDGETLVIGGMISKTKSNSDEGIPWLRKIPIIKYLFGNFSVSTKSTELLIMITPHVIETYEEAKYVSEEFKSKVESLLNEIKKARKSTTVNPESKIKEEPEQESQKEFKQLPKQEQPKQDNKEESKQKK